MIGGILVIIDFKHPLYLHKSIIWTVLHPIHKAKIKIEIIDVLVEKHISAMLLYLLIYAKNMVES